MPEQYAAPYTHHVVGTHPNNPAALSDGRIIMRGMDADNNIMPLLFDPADWSVTELPCGGGGLFPSPGGTTAFAKRDSRLEEGLDNLLLHFSDGDVTYTQLPEQWQVEGYMEPFHIGDRALVREGVIYVTAYCPMGDGPYQQGVFRWDGEEMALVRLIPDAWMLTLLGADEEGSLYILLHGIADSEDMDVMVGYEGRKQRILEMLGEG